MHVRLLIAVLIALVLGLAAACSGQSQSALPTARAPAAVRAQPPVSVPLQGARFPSSTTNLCAPYAWKTVLDPAGNTYVIRNDLLLDTGCISNVGDGANFTVNKSTASSTTSANSEFPEIFAGCQYGICTRFTGLPAPWTSIPHIYANVITRQNAPGLWNSAFDIWFGRTPARNGQAKGTEIMIWLGTGDNSSGVVPTVHINGYDWYVRHWHSCNSVTGGCWNYVMYWSVNNHITAIHHFDLVPFFRYANMPGTAGTGPALWKPWYLLNVSYGDEIWTQGNGLSVSSFRLSGLPEIVHSADHGHSHQHGVH